MRKYLLGTALVAALTGCTADWEPGRPSSGAGSSEAVPLPVASGHLPRDPAQGFASLPDQGVLIAYDRGRKATTAGAYTSHPVKISEAHAFNAIAKGEMVLQGPNGEPIRLGYSSHEEHADGSWTWVGEDEGGNPSVLTFGQDAVFGRVGAGDEVYRINTDRNGAWLVQTDSSKLSGRSGAPVGGETDFLTPPSGVTLAQVGSDSSRTLAGPEPTITPKAASIVVDLVAGYTSGLLSPTTQINQMVAEANAAYQRSGINYRVRLVHALLVNYGEVSTNQETLRNLTGYNEVTKQAIPVDAAFNALRAAREEYGGDLVTLIRPHRSPEQKGCGIAWLLGSKGAAITTAKDAAFGYSVVSVGIDRDENDGNNYECANDTLAHELGHNMGQVHNSGDAETAGMHPYSYGYREASTTGFYTIMAYPLDNSAQKPASYFANPAVSYSGRTTGVANSADNARSMNITMPLVAAFRATKVALKHDIKNDFDGDGKADVFWRNSSTGAAMIWPSANYSLRYDEGTVASSAWQPVASGDFDGDGKSDIFWRNSATGDNIVWPSGKYALRKAMEPVRNLDWQVVGAGDFNGDGKVDIFWRNSSTGANIIWWAGVYAGNSAATAVGTAWKVVGVGDFNGDGQADIFWRNSVTGANIIWWSGTYSSSGNKVETTVPNQAWTVAAVGDFNGDKKADIFWRNTSTGQHIVWPSGSFTGNYTEPAVSTQWKLVAVGDYNGDGFDDLFWRNSVTGDNIVWWSGKYANRAGLTAVVTAAWTVKH